MEKIINVLLVVVIGLLLKNMYFPKLTKIKGRKNRRQRTQKEELKNENEFTFNGVSIKNLVMPGNGNHTDVLPVGILEVITKDETKEVPVSFNKRGQFLIGSASNCDLVLHSPYIGSHHCSIEYDEENDEIVLFDNDSRNGIYDTNKNRVEEIVMEKGKDFYLAKCLHLRWKEFDGFDLGEEKNSVSKKEDSTGTISIPRGMLIAD